jgi:hypothetical protein
VKIVIWSEYIGKKLLLVALSLVLLTHGVIFYFTLPQTYDAFVHIFFADHYARFWFEPWEYRWYTGFLTISYPPLVHQLTGLLSKILPLKVAFCVYAIFIYEVLVLGIYRFTKLFFDKTTAGVAALIVVGLSSMVETLHVYGQLPTLTGIAFLLNSMPFLYQYFTKGKLVSLAMALVFLAVVVSAHHVTAIFGMIFFIVPTIFMALVDDLKTQPKPFFKFVIEFIKHALKKYKELFAFGFIIIILIICLIFPFWYWSKTSQINQISIPHGSRDNFLKNTSSGLIFFLIPLILVFALFPAISYSITRQKRLIGWAVAFFLCLLLGSGGTTPLPKIILGSNAFNILTLDRFGFWASIIAIPFMAKFIHSFISGPVQDFWVKRFGSSNHFILSGLSGFTYALFLIFIFHLGSFRPLQPKSIDIQPILKFINRDEHIRWRYLTLGFGDQMAWLSANSKAATVDGNYHSARSLPELTSRPIERLENAKFNGTEGIASLNDFLANAEKYNLKYVFSNDRYYDPLLYYTGWNRTIRLENGIMVWEKGNISIIKPLTPPLISPILKYAWGIIPIASLCFAILMTIGYLRWYKQKDYFVPDSHNILLYPKCVIYSSSILPIIFFSIFIAKQLVELLVKQEQKNPELAVQNYYNHLDFQRFENAFNFFVPSPTYPLNQYLLEKSVNEGGLLPSYAKLDSIATLQLQSYNNTAMVKVYTRWRTSVGQREQIDTLKMKKIENKWYIEPTPFVAVIPNEQMRSYNFTIFKKLGKRVISSFPTVKDDRVKKPFAAYKQVNFIQYGNTNFITGEILNADDIPINVALKIIVYYKNNTHKEFYPNRAFQYNLLPKASNFFQVDLDNKLVTDSLKIDYLELYTETDVSDIGYIHGGTPIYSVKELQKNLVEIDTKIYNELSTDINIPGILIAEKDTQGNIWQVALSLHTSAVRSSFSTNFKSTLKKIQQNASMVKSYPIRYFINGQERFILPVKKDVIATDNNGIAILPHCFISQEIYFQ